MDSNVRHARRIAERLRAFPELLCGVLCELASDKVAGRWDGAELDHVGRADPRTGLSLAEVWSDKRASVPFMPWRWALRVGDAAHGTAPSRSDAQRAADELLRERGYTLTEWEMPG